ncbi:MAG: recombinase family protein [Faecousia sp.]
MELRKIRAELAMGRRLCDLPLRVTFYARVSTDKDEQRNSLENQVQYYTELIRSKPNWTFIPGYIDEGISGTSTKNRDAFNRMIRDAGAGRFDFIITKEISRFSRSTLDSIRYTQELLEHDVGVLFQNDNINTMDPDSEFRLVVMAGVAQDEVRKLSQRLKFGFRQAIKNGHVLGNDRLYGYDKHDCVLTVNEDEARIVRTIFTLYADEGLGVRRISRRLLELGYTSREGNAFNTLTIRHIIENPKYKGWYCGNKTQSVDYRTRKKAVLDASEWVMYPDPAIPAIVPEALWDRANALYRQRSTQSRQHSSGAVFHNRYPYSGKLFCEEHGTPFYRRTLKSAGGEREVWQCRVYCAGGRAACTAPQISSGDLTPILANIFSEQLVSGQAVADCLVAILSHLPRQEEADRAGQKLREQIGQCAAKKDRLLELSMAGALSAGEFKIRNDGFNDRIQTLEKRLAALGEENRREETMDIERIRRALEDALIFADGMNPALPAALVERILVRKQSVKTEIHLDILLKTGARYEAVYVPQKPSARLIRLKNITPRLPTRRT